MKKTLSLLLFLAVSLGTWAQVSFSVNYKRVSPTEIDIIFTGKAGAGWHIYGKDIAEGGPTAASFGTDVLKGARLKGGLKEGPGLKRKQDPIFEMPVTYFEGTATFTQRIELTEKNYEVKGYLRYGACNDESCLPPTSVDAVAKGSDGPAAAAATPTAATPAQAGAEMTAVEATTGATTHHDEAQTDSLAPVQAAVAATDSASVQDLWTPVIDELKAFGGDDHGTGNKSFLLIFGLGFIGGLLALVTPCVWPIIPMTVSFFLKRNSDRSKAVREAITYGISIVVIYVALGLIITSIFGASALNDLSTNAIFNIIFFLMLVVFGASFLGGFEITLPSSWSNAVDQKASSTTGLLSIFLMAFTLALVSFSCTGPIIGFLLVEVSTSGGSAVAPTIGMLGFAFALALPFTLFALFPTLLKKTSRGGSWMNTVKVVLGFLELAFALKFFSVADLAYGWGLLDRETFLALWIALFTLLALYLFKLVKFPHDDADERNTSVPQFFLGIISLAFAIYMLPGLWGAPTKAVSAFAPPMNTQDFNLDHVKVEPKFTDYEAGMAYARANGKPVLIDFTGFGCVNCRKMEMSVWHDAKVRDIINKDYVLISLYVDDKTKLPEPLVVEENGQSTTLRTVGDRWSYLQRVKFGANAQPFYVLLDAQGKPLAPSRSYDEDIDAYVKFLQSGLKQFAQ
ncbi:MAG: cytochrome c biogenesis protein CcdA [Bacteroidales bacterium]|nr:cytochrome c biogenesis protein CcdA [Bacteroidales bacterium]